MWLIALIILAALLFGLGFVVKWLFILAAVVLVLALIYGVRTSSRK